jgi:pectin lyase
MRSSTVIAAFAAFISSVTAADAVKGAAEGFAKGTIVNQDFKEP